MHESVIKVLMSLRITKRQQKELHRISRLECVHVSEIVRAGIEYEIERRIDSRLTGRRQVRARREDAVEVRE